MLAIVRRFEWSALIMSVWLGACRAPGPSSPRFLLDPNQPQHARSAILFIGDGMGDSEITIARNYHLGAAGRLHMDHLPFTGDCTTYAVEEDDPKKPVYVADSAAGGTALATGVKTSNRRVNTTPLSGAPLTTITDMAQAAGLRTGVVTTADLTDATPACFASHISHRYCRAPNEMQVCPHDTKSSGGAGSIAEQLADGHVDVILGGGRTRFEQVIGDGPNSGKSSRQVASARGYAVVDTATDLEAFIKDPPSGATSLLGLFAIDDLAPIWTGEPARSFPGSGPQRCVEGQRPPTQPSLAQMTNAALAILDRPNPEGRPGPGFFLMVEGASIDKRDHAADPCGQIGETIDLDEAVAAAQAYSDKHPDTLVIITADHGQSSQSIFPPGDIDHSPGVFSQLVTREGAVMTVNYGTNSQANRQSHSGTQVRVAAQGPGAAAVVGLIDHTDVFRIMVDALGLRSRSK